MRSSKRGLLRLSELQSYCLLGSLQRGSRDARLTIDGSLSSSASPLKRPPKSRFLGHALLACLLILTSGCSFGDSASGDPPASPIPPAPQVDTFTVPPAEVPTATGSPGGSSPGGSSPGGSSPGGSSPGGSSPGGSSPGGSNPGGSSPGGSNPGGSNPGGSSPGSSNPGSSNPGSSNPGSSNPGSSNPGSSNPGGSEPTILLGGPSVENRNPNTAWPSILVYGENRRSGCGELHNDPEVQIPVKVLRVDLRGTSGFKLTSDWQRCLREGYSASAERGCIGAVLEAGAVDDTNGCLVSVQAPLLQFDPDAAGNVGATARLSLTLEATCRSNAGKPCQQLQNVATAPRASASSPVKVRWTTQIELDAIAQPPLDTEADDVTDGNGLPDGSTDSDQNDNAENGSSPQGEVDEPQNGGVEGPN
ncbi:hypothetical protein EV188_102933 [Actinomycetospora succinea]|uniref:Uncharacterized protein n=1 Tax=Actinomycetospora succinea TaxID=663603 RepID=A0A4R6VK99_9PSEU|nr:hypothetical protein EV188_102933 [Actinomycetospora succinea]